MCETPLTTEPSVTWACVACTFENHASQSKCDVCTTPKPGDEPAAVHREVLQHAGVKRPRALDDAASPSSTSTRHQHHHVEVRPLQHKESIQPSGTENTRTSFKLLSYNVWFDSLMLRERMNAIGEIIELHSPDIITMQEVQKDILACFQSSAWSKQYTMTRLPFYDSYFTLIFSKAPLRHFSQSSLPRSIMGRDLKVIEVTLAGQSCAFATAHLESPVGPWQGGPSDQFSSVRALQLAQAFGTLGGLSCSNVFFSGDMNWIARDGVMQLSDGWIDAWLKLHPGEVRSTISYHDR